MRSHACEVAYIIKPDFSFLGEVEDFSYDDTRVLENWGPLLSDGDLVRCFYHSGFIETFVIHIDPSRVWPEIYRFDKVSS